MKLFKSKVFYLLLSMAISVVAVNGFMSRIGNIATEIENNAESYDFDFEEEFEFPELEKLPEPVTMVEEEPIEDELPAETKPVAIALPLQGELLNEHSEGELVYNKTMEDWRTHNGIDIAAEVGTAIKAAADGVVEFAGADGLNGYCVIIDHGSFKTKYCGLQESDIISPDAQVKAGDVIGGVGVTCETESAETPHLHFELIVDDKSENPLKFVENIML